MKSIRVFDLKTDCNMAVSEGYSLIVTKTNIIKCMLILSRHTVMIFGCCASRIKKLGSQHSDHPQRKSHAFPPAQPANFLTVHAEY